MTLEKKLKELGLTEQEAIDTLRQLSRPQKKVNYHKHHFHPKHIKLGIISDTHIGSKYFNYQAFEDSIQMFNREKVDAIYHAGDVIEGMSNRDGHIYELEVAGTSGQIDLAVKLLSQYKQPLFFTTGNHDEWAKNKSNQGILVGPDIEERIKGSTFLGEYTANVELAPNVVMRLTHEGSNSYALSYSLQKRVNALEGGSKPQIIANGHIHKMIYMWYRNIHCFEAGTLLNQTPFMSMKGSPAHVGYWVLDLEFDKTGLKGIKQTARPFY